MAGLGLSLVGHHDVCALDIAVDDAFAVSLGEAGRDLGGDIQSFLCRKRPALDFVPEGFPLHILHGDKGPVFGFPNFIDDADVWAGEGRGRLSFDDEPPFELGGVHEVRRKEFQGDRTFEREILRLVDDPHPAAADFLDDPVLAGNEAVFSQELYWSFKRFR